MAKRALLIGCNYIATPQVALQGCINDIVNVRSMLIDAYGYQDSNIFMLRDDVPSQQPTRANILNCMASVINYSAPGDTLWIHYSGHGTQIRDTNSDESDGLDEAIVPCDFSKAGMISDDDLFNIVKLSKCTLILCFDSCHSGTVCDLQYSMNCGSNGVLTKMVNNSKFVSDNNIIMLSGCRDAQTSADSYSYLAKQGVGAFTNALLETLRANSHNIDIIKLYTGLCAYLQKSGFTQIPVLSSTIPNPVYQFSRPSAVAASQSTSSSASTGVTKITKEFLFGGSSLRGRMKSLIEQK